MVTLPALFLATYLVGHPVAHADRRGAVRDRGARSRWSRSLRSRYPILRRIAASRCRCSCSPAPSTSSPASPSRSASSRSSCTRRCWCSCPRSSRTPARSAASSSARVSTKLHLGTLVPGRGSLRSIGEDFLLVYLYAIPVFLLLGVSADIAALVVGLKSPGSLEMIAVSMLAGVIATTFAVLVGFYGAVAAVPAGARSRQPRDPHRHVEPRPARRVRAHPRRSSPSASPEQSARRGRTARVRSSAEVLAEEREHAVTTRRLPTPRRSSPSRRA